MSVPFQLQNKNRPYHMESINCSKNIELLKSPEQPSGYQSHISLKQIHNLQNSSMLLNGLSLFTSRNIRCTNV